MYSWSDVAERLEKAYDRVLQMQADDAMTRLRKYFGCGPIAGFIFCIIVSIGMMWARVLEWLVPAAEMDRTPDWISKM